MNAKFVLLFLLLAFCVTVSPAAASYAQAYAASGYGYPGLCGYSFGLPGWGWSFPSFDWGWATSAIFPH
ncbi:hypothetical protein [Methanocella paludicola]|uniref:hypothetical protein n=1 Tax=Methanocella paludicola TaxID=570267 RepID=UPI000FFC5915|nr:hypothetical protein [Methanocella paludicola]